MTHSYMLLTAALLAAFLAGGGVVENGWGEEGCDEAREGQREVRKANSVHRLYCLDRFLIRSRSI